MHAGLKIIYPHSVSTRKTQISFSNHFSRKYHLSENFRPFTIILFIIIVKGHSRQRKSLISPILCLVHLRLVEGLGKNTRRACLNSLELDTVRRYQSAHVSPISCHEINTDHDYFIERSGYNNKGFGAVWKFSGLLF